MQLNCNAYFHWLSRVVKSAVDRPEGIPTPNALVCKQYADPDISDYECDADADHHSTV